MKALHLCLVVFFTCTICLFAASSEVLAAAEKQEASVAADTAVTPPAALPAEKKGAAKAKKELPTNVDINTADRDLLIDLPGIGPKTADAILAYRQENGTFKSLDELTRVKGIGDKTLVKLKPYLQEI